MNHPTKNAAQYFLRVFSLLMLLLFANVAYGQNTISTVAGSAAPNNVSPTAASIEGPVGVVRDASGNLFVLTDSGVIYKVTAGTAGTAAPSTLVIFAGNNTAGLTASGIQATAARTNEPDGGALDANGNFYFADGGNCVIREVVASTGIINTIVGNGTCGFSGDNGPATSAQLNFPQGIAFDGSGNLYIADINNNVIRRVAASTNIITTYAGTGAQGFSGDGNQATSATFEFPQAVATDANGNLFIADSGNNVIRRVDVGTNVITTVVGSVPGNAGYSGDGGPATGATLRQPGGIAVDAAENLYISDSDNAVVRKVTASTNIITTIIGNHGFGFGGDGGPALSATLTNPLLLTVDSTTGNVWIPDFWNNRVRMYTAGNLQISTVVGNGLVGDGGPATSASLYDPRSPALDSQGNLYIVDAQNNRIREANATNQTTSTVVGNGIPCAFPTSPCGDGGLATSASIFIPRTVTIEPSGNLLIGDGNDNRIREVAGGTITTIAGSGNQCTNATLPCGDGGPATSASLFDPRAAVVDSSGNIYITDSQDNRIRRVDATTQVITTVAGNGPNGNAPVGCPGSYSGDGGPAVDSTLSCPLSLDIDSNGNLYISDTFNNRIRRIDAVTQIITTVAGNGTQGFSGDGGAATNASLNQPDRISINGAGNIFISDTNNERIRRVDGTTGIITTFAGNGNFGFSGDGGPALSASFATPVGVVVDNLGNMYVGDVLSNRIRKVLLNPNITLSSNTAAFASQALNVSATLAVTVTNSGDAPLTISSISITPGAFSLSSNPCPLAPATLAVGAQCALEIAFIPTQFITYTGTITISDNGPTPGSTQNIDLTGMGAAALTVTTSGSGTVTSSPAGINCPTTCSATFVGNGQVVLTATAGTGATFTNFSSNCVPASPQTSPPSCTVSTATSGVTVTATFSQTSSVIIAIAPGGSSTATTVSGGTAFYGLTITGAPGVTGTVQLGCVPSSVLITCKVIPASVTLNGGSTEVAFAIQTFCQGTTTATGFVTPIVGGVGGGIGGGIGLLLVTMVFGGAVWTFRRNRRVALTFATLLLVALGSAACNSLPKGPNGATPAGTYSLSLTTSLNGAPPQTLNNFLTLVVK